MTYDDALKQIELAMSYAFIAKQTIPQKMVDDWAWMKQKCEDGVKHDV